MAVAVEEAAVAVEAVAVAASTRRGSRRERLVKTAAAAPHSVSICGCQNDILR